MASCFSCGAKIEVERVYRSTDCPSCSKSVKVCKNCRFYAPGAHWDCHETISEPVRDKEQANFCDFFELARDSKASDKDSSSRSSFDSLFDS